MSRATSLEHGKPHCQEAHTSAWRRKNGAQGPRSTAREAQTPEDEEGDEDALPARSPLLCLARPHLSCRILSQPYLPPESYPNHGVVVAAALGPLNHLLRRKGGLKKM